MKEGDAQLLVIHFDTFYSLPPPHTCPYRDYNCPYLWVLPFHIDSICHWEHYPPLPLAGPATRPTIITHSIRGLRYELRVFFFAEIPSTSDLRPMHMFTMSVSRREKKNERHKSKSQKLFSIFYILRTLDGSEWPIYLPYLFIYLCSRRYLVP